MGGRAYGIVILGVKYLAKPPLRPCVPVVLALSLLLGAEAASAQTPEDDVSPRHAGPTLEADAATVQPLGVHERGFDSPWIRDRYAAFAREFAADFGVAGLEAEAATSDMFLDALRRRLSTRFGDTTVYGWVERGLFLYARMKAYTEMESRGFDFEVEMDEMAEGKLGLRVNRAFQ